MHKVGQLGLLRSRRLQLDGPSLQRLGVFRPTSSPSLIVHSPGCLRWRNGGPHEPRRSVAKFSRRHQKKEEENQKENVHERTQIEPHSKEILNFAEWRLTVGLEIHAQLNTARKLFSGWYYNYFTKNADLRKRQRPRLMRNRIPMLCHTI